MKVNGHGSIIQLQKCAKSKCRRWRVFISIGKDPQTGKYKQKSKCIKGKYTDAQKALRDLINDIESAELTPSMSFNNYAKNWLSHRAKTMSYGTYRRDLDRIKCAQIHIGKLQLNAITPKILETMYASLLDGNSPSGKKLSGTYVADIATALHTLFRDALREKLITSNPCDYARRPSADTPERKALTSQEMQRLVNSLDASDPCQLAILLCVKTGIRRGEVHGLSWCDVDDCLHIKHSFDDGGNLKPPKTRKSVRLLPITQSVKNDLRIAQQRAERLNIFAPAAPVIANEIGERLLPHSTSRWWARHRDELGFSDWTVHELRHSYLSELARRGVPPRVLQEIAGHESYKTTEDIYVHVQNDELKTAINKADW